MERIDVINLILAIKDIEQEAGKMKHEANQMMSKADGMFSAAASLKKEFELAISTYEKSRK